MEQQKKQSFFYTLLLLLNNTDSLGSSGKLLDVKLDFTDVSTTLQLSRENLW